MKKLFLASVFSFGLLTVSSGSAFAQAASCLSGGNAVPAPSVQAAQANPANLLTQFPQGGPAMARFIGRLVGTDTDLASPILDAAANAPAAQVAAIGAGLARAASACAEDHPELADKIRTVIVAQSVSHPEIAEVLNQSFQATSQEITTAALPPALDQGPVDGVDGVDGGEVSLGSDASSGGAGGTVDQQQNAGVPQSPSNVFSNGLSSSGSAGGATSASPS